MQTRRRRSSGLPLTSMGGAFGQMLDKFLIRLGQGLACFGHILVGLG